MIPATRPQANAGSAFSLIAFIAILALMLLPAINTAHEASQPSVCRGNYRQLAQTATAYAAANDDIQAPAFSSGAPPQPVGLIIGLRPASWLLLQGADAAPRTPESFRPPTLTLRVKICVLKDSSDQDDLFDAGQQTRLGLLDPYVCVDRTDALALRTPKSTTADFRAHQEGAGHG